jgi:hypothetical protein
MSMNSSDINEIDVAIEVLDELAKELPVQYCRSEARIPNKEGYDSIETHLHYEHSGTSAASLLCATNCANRRSGLERKNRRAGSRKK